MKPEPKKLIVDWVIKSCQDISNKILVKSKKSCGHVTQDRLVSCFKDSKKCEVRKALLKTQILNLTDKNIHENSFEISEDMAAVALLIAQLKKLIISRNYVIICKM